MKQQNFLRNNPNKSEMAILKHMHHHKQRIGNVHFVFHHIVLKVRACSYLHEKWKNGIVSPWKAHGNISIPLNIPKFCGWYSQEAIGTYVLDSVKPNPWDAAVSTFPEGFNTADALRMWHKFYSTFGPGYEAAKF